MMMSQNPVSERAGKPVKIAIAANFDPRDITSWSGCSHYLSKALESENAKLTYIGPLEQRKSFLYSAKIRIYHRLFGQRYLTSVDPLTLKWCAQQVAIALDRSDADFILSLDAMPIAYLETNKPIIYYWDCTFAGNMEYPVFKNLAPESIKHGHRMEQMALDKCRFAVFSSEWAVNTAIDSYGVDPRKLRIAPLGANLDCSRTLDDVARLVDARSPKKCKLLFMGVDWIRKGGDVAFEVARELNARGLETTLTIAGCEPQIEKPFPGFVKSMGFINKFEGDNGRILEGLLGESHFLIVPSTAEAFGAVFCEASSFATPSLARRVGGIPTAVKDGVSGKLFARDAGASEYCDYILSLFEDYSKYRALALTAFREYESRLNWERTSQTLMGLFREIESTTSR